MRILPSGFSISCFAVAVFLSSPAFAETFELRNGGRLMGKLLNPDDRPRTSYRIKLDTGGEVTLAPTDVRKVRRLSENEKRYQTLLKQIPSDTAKHHLLVAKQCSKWMLPQQREFHLQQVIRLEPNHAEARKALGYREQADGSWAKPEDIKKAEGKTRVDGKWVSAQQAKLMAADEARKQVAIRWKKDLRMWKKWMKDGRRRAVAVKNFREIDDPMAASTLVELFQEESHAATKEMFAEVLGKLDSGIAVSALAAAALDGDTEMRYHCVRQLKENGHTSAMGYFRGALNSSSKSRINRAAYALGELGDKASILPLIYALRTTHTYKVGGGNQGMNATFDPTGRSGGGLSMGNKKPKKVTKTFNNRPVLTALVRLTDQDFEYNQPKWKSWYLSRTTPKTSLRRDN